jgi:nanoRNase/pAp phosphatase (c-di-AMP/oligoRNAs hydrolase)
LESFPVGNRFLIYTLFPEANVSLRIAWGPERAFVVATVGHSIFNRTCPVHVGKLMARYGGGGHEGAGATPLSPKNIDRTIQDLVLDLQKT